MRKYSIGKSLMKAIIYSLVLGTVNYGVASAGNPPAVHEDNRIHDYSDNINIVETAVLINSFNVAIGAAQDNTVINFKKDVGINLANTAFVSNRMETFGICSLGSTINFEGNLIVDIDVGADTAHGLVSVTPNGLNIKGNTSITMYAGQGGSVIGVGGHAPTTQGNTDINIYAADGAVSAYGYKDLRDRRIPTPLNISGGIQNINIEAENVRELGGLVKWYNTDINLINNTVVGINIKNTNRNINWFNMQIQGVIGVLNLEGGSKLNINMDLGKKSTFDAANLYWQSTAYNYGLTTAGLYIVPAAGTGLNEQGYLQSGSETYIKVSGAPLWDTEDFYGRKFGSGSVVGLAALSGVQVDGKLTVEVVSEKGVGILVHDGVDAAGKIELNGETIVNTNKGYALLSESVNWSDNSNRYWNLNYNTESRIDINKNGGSLVQIVGDIDHRTLRESQYTINLDSADSFLMGSSMQSNAKEINYNNPNQQLDGEATIYNVRIIQPKGSTDIMLANGAHWYMTGLSDNNVTGNSVVNELTFSNKGYLDMTPSGKDGYETLTVAKLLGSDGKILFNTDLQQSFDNKDVLANSDKIVITTASAGVHTIDIKDASLLGNLASTGYLLLVEDRSQWTVGFNDLLADQGLDEAVFVGGELQKCGIFKYKPIITSVEPEPESGYSNIPTNATNWYLTGFEKQGVNDEVFVNAGLAESRYVSYMNEQDTLVKRLGELRQSDKEKGIWVRTKGANNSVDGAGVNRNSYVSTYLGYDWKLHEKDQSKDKSYMGVAFNHTNNNFDYALGASGKGQSNALTLYGTRLGQKGHYLDLVGKIGRMSSDYKYQENTVVAKNWFYSLSAEYGRSIVRDKGWYYEPQVQFTLGRINGTSYNANGIHVDADGITSAILRGGILAGRKFNEDKQEKLGSYYAKVFYNYEFGGNVKATMSDTFGDSFNFSHNYKGGWLTVGVGTSLNLNKKTNLYLDVEKAFGGKVSGGWAWQGGVRWRF